MSHIKMQRNASLVSSPIRGSERMWVPDLVRSRFLEAADTEIRLPLGGRSSSGFWPKYVHSFEEMKGWGEQRLKEHRQEVWLRRPAPSASEVSRYLEVLQWSATMIEDRKRQRITWDWAFCQVTRRSFAEHCRKHGFVKMTAYRRLSAVFADISEKLRNNNVLLRYPEHTFTVTRSAGYDSNSPTLAVPDDEPQTHPTFHIFDGDRPGDMLTSPQAVESFEKHLAKVNKQRRREQEKRRKLGIEESAA